MDKVNHIGTDVHKEANSIAVLNCSIKSVMNCTFETKARCVVDLLRGLRGSSQVYQSLVLSKWRVESRLQLFTWTDHARRGRRIAEVARNSQSNTRCQLY